MKPLPFKWLAFALVLAFWPVLSWYASATLDGSNDAWGLLALATVGAIAFSSPMPAANPLRYPLALPMLLLLAYLGATVCALAPSLRALLALLTLAALLCSWRLGQRMNVALFGLCLLALPLAASMQFYLGYPLRVVAGKLAAALLQLNGVAVIAEGALLNWGGQMLAIDVACSGVKMLWTSMYLTYTLAALYRLSAIKTFTAISFALCCVVLSNAIRASALFYSETDIIELPSWGHTSIGMLMFSMACAAIVVGVLQLQEKT